LYDIIMITQMLYFVTSNKDKIFLAKKNLEPLGIKFDNKPFEIPEIQSDNDREVAIRKAVDAFGFFQNPLFVSDDSWYIPSLNGFPGPYMKNINQWLNAEDLIRLMEPYENRKIILRQTICFTDGKETKIFSQDNNGIILNEPQGKGYPSLQITSFNKNGKSLAECIEENVNPIDNIKIWTDFGKWYLSRV